MGHEINRPIVRHVLTCDLRSLCIVVLSGCLYNTGNFLGTLRDGYGSLKRKVDHNKFHC